MEQDSRAGEQAIRKLESASPGMEPVTWPDSCGHDVSFLGSGSLL